MEVYGTVLTDHLLNVTSTYGRRPYYDYSTFLSFLFCFLERLCLEDIEIISNKIDSVNPLIKNYLGVLTLDKSQLLGPRHFPGAQLSTSADIDTKTWHNNDNSTIQCTSKRQWN